MEIETQYKDIHNSIVTRCKNGDKKAYYELYDLYAGAMFNISMRIINRETEAEDILQESFLSAFQNLHHFDGKQSFGSWLKRIVINRSIDFRRKQKTEIIPLDEVEYAEEEKTEEDIVYDIDSIKKCIQDLPDGYRIVLTLYLFEEYSHKEIAELLKISEGTSKSQYNRAKKKLKELIKQKTSFNNKKHLLILLIMNDKLEIFIRGHRKELDAFKPPQKLWYKIEANIQSPSFPNPSLIKSKLSWLKYFGFGLSAVVAVIIYFKLSNNNKQAENNNIQKTVIQDTVHQNTDTISEKIKPVEVADKKIDNKKEVQNDSVLPLTTKLNEITPLQKEKNDTTPASSAIDISNFDLTVKPADDFYKYINGNWLKNNPIPPGNSSWGTFSVLRQQNAENLKNLIEEITKDNSSPAGSERQMIRDFYLSAMDSVNIEKQTSATLLSLFAKINSIKNTDQLATVMGWLQLNICNAAFRFYKNWDPKNANHIIAFIDQYGGYALPDRNYYLKDDNASENIRTQYLGHIQNMMELAGQNTKDAKITADGVLQLETIFAITNMTKEESRDPKNSYFKMNFQELKKLAPSFNWKNYFDALGLKNRNEFNVVPPDFFGSFSEAVKHNPLDEWKRYLKWCVLNTATPYLSSLFVNENFNYFEKALKGTTTMKPRWQAVIEQEQAYLGWPLAKEWVKKYYSPKAKEMMLLMIDDIKNAFKLRIQKLDWMNEETKIKAIDKLNKITVKVGYPDKWENLSGITISKNNYLQNTINYSNYATAKQVDAVGKPANKNEWGMTPQEVNAYYNAVQNEIVFPAGILQAPFFDEKYDAAANYGAIGCVIAHEFTHAFDDQGSQYDADGNLNNWWTADDLKKFEEKQKLIIDQYNQYTILDTLHLNGALTVGENIADLGGVNIAYEAFQIYQQKHGRQQNIGGFTPEQRFFIAWTQIWRQNKTPEALALQVNSSTTSPYLIRGFAPLSNCQGFIDAFNLKEGDKMALPKNKRFTIW